MRISPSVVVAPWMLVWPDIDWYLLEVKGKEKGKVDLVSGFKYYVMKEEVILHRFILTVVRSLRQE